MPAIEPLAALPVFFRLRDRPVLLAGAGAGIAWKAELLAATGACVRLCAPSASAEFSETVANLAGVELLSRAWRDEDFEGVALAILDTLDEEEAHAFRAAARLHGAPVNVVDRPAFCDFSFGSIVNRSPLIVAISTDGAAPVFGQALRARIEAILPQALKAWAEAARDWRARVAPLGWDFRRRRGFWERFAELALGAGNRPPAEGDFAALATAREAAARPASGRIALVGGGPGDPELMTLKAVRALQSADVILYDSLVGEGVLELARREAQREFVGKRAGAPSPKQAEITARMIALARAGKRVVRLKGGDPGVFGRASEEIRAARAAGLEIDIVPGVTTAFAAAAELGRSLTDRDLAPRLQFVTISDRDDDTSDQLSWSALADPFATTALYMGARKLGAIVARLISEGVDPMTPSVYLENVSRPDARRIAAPLHDLAETVAAQASSGPGLVLYGRALGEEEA